MATPARQLTAPALCDRLSDGWLPPHADVAEEAFTRLCQRLQGRVTGHRHPCAGGFVGQMALNHVRLRGASEIGFIMISPRSHAVNVLMACRRSAEGRLWLAVNGADAHSLIASPHASRLVVLPLDQLKSLLLDPQPLEQLKAIIRRQIQLPQLNPYDITSPVEPNMFFGRRELVERLLSDDSTSFAIAGPGRIGKSSIIAQFRYQRLVRRDDRRERSTFIDCYPLRFLDPDTVANRIATSIESSASARQVNRHTFLRYLQSLTDDGRQPIELLLDEVDSICGSAAFQEIGEAVRCKYCRVILCGKGELYRLVGRRENQFHQRLDVILPEPLDNDSCERLLLEPIRDMGLAVASPGDVRDRVVEITGRKPHLIQASAKRLVEAAVQRGESSVTPALFDDLRDELIDRFYGTLPLEDLRDDLSRLMCLLVLRAGGLDTQGSSPRTLASTSRAEPRLVNVGYLQELARRKGIALAAERALDICDELWIVNLLIREHGQFRLPNSHLSTFIRRLNFNDEIQRLAREISATQQASSRPLII